MKQLLVSIFILLHYGQIHAQCIVDAGPAKHFCQSNIGVDQQIEASIISGIPP